MFMLDISGIIRWVPSREVMGPAAYNTYRSVSRRDSKRSYYGQQ